MDTCMPSSVDLRVSCKIKNKIKKEVLSLFSGGKSAVF